MSNVSRINPDGTAWMSRNHRGHIIPNWCRWENNFLRAQQQMSKSTEAQWVAPGTTGSIAGRAAGQIVGNSNLSLFLSLSPARSTVAYDSFWKFASERQAAFFKRVGGEPPPWT